MRRPAVVLSNKILTDKQLRAMLSVGLDHPMIRAVTYVLEVRIQQAMQNLDSRMTKAELTYALGRQDAALDILVEIRDLARIETDATDKTGDE